MIKLNLETNNEAEERIKAYLEKNVSEILADKINNGVQITKNEKILTNKKTLSGFMKHASEEARKLAEKGASFACIEDSTVYGWAIHYFEEDSIEDKLYNQDGSEYKTEIKTTPKATPKIEKVKKKESNQQSLFDLMKFCDDEHTNEDLEEPPIEYDTVEESDNDIDDFDEEEIEEALEIIAEENKFTNAQIDLETGEIQPKANTFDKESIKLLYSLLDGNLEAK